MPSSLTSPLYTTKTEIEYWELDKGYRENWIEDNSNLTRRLGVLWSNRVDFGAEMLGNAEAIAGSLFRTLPEEDIEFPGYYAASMVLVNGAGYPGRDDATNALKYLDRSELDNDEPTDGLAIYDVLFTKPMYRVLSDEDADNSDLLELSRFVIRGREFNGEMLPLPSRFLEWESAPRDQIPAAAVVPLPKGVYEYTWKMVPEDGWDEERVNGVIGKVNSTLFDNYFLAETLLFLGPKVRRYQHANGTIYLDVTYTFEYRRQTHNKFLRADRQNAEPDFEYVRRIKAPTKRVFEKVDFLEELFTVL